MTLSDKLKVLERIEERNVFREGDGTYVISKQLKNYQVSRIVGYSSLRRWMRSIKMRGVSVVEDADCFRINFYGSMKELKPHENTILKQSLKRCLGFITGVNQNATTSSELCKIDVDEIIEKRYRDFVVHLEESLRHQLRINLHYRNLLIEHEKLKVECDKLKRDYEQLQTNIL